MSAGRIQIAGLPISKKLTALLGGGGVVAGLSAFADLSQQTQLALIGLLAVYLVSQAIVDTFRAKSGEDLPDLVSANVRLKRERDEAVEQRNQRDAEWNAWADREGRPTEGRPTTTS